MRPRPEGQEDGGSTMKTLARTTGPSLLHMCSCGHAVTEHRRKGERPCLLADCHCERYELVRLPRCETCNHLPALHFPKTPQGIWACTSPACRCGEWQQPRLNESNDSNHGNDDRCVVVMESSHARVTISVPREAKREVLISETPTGMFDVVITGSSRSRLAAATNAARSG